MVPQVHSFNSLTLTFNSSIKQLPNVERSCLLEWRFELRENAKHCVMETDE
jgi:hypothetical protein